MDLLPYFYYTLLICILEHGARAYETYTVERDCSSGNLTLELKGSGPSSALLLRTTDHTSYSLSGQCRIELRAPHRIVAAVREIGFRKNYDGTCQDYIQIGKPMCSYLYRLEEERHFYSTGDTLQILHVVSDQGIDNSTLTGYPGAKLSITALTPEMECPGTRDWFRCRNGFCVWSELKCDSHNNCGDRSDEMDCGSPGGSQSTALIILAVLIVLLLLIMCVATLLCSKNETVRRFSNRLRSRTISYMTRVTMQQTVSNGFSQFRTGNGHQK